MKVEFKKLTREFLWEPRYVRGVTIKETRNETNEWLAFDWFKLKIIFSWGFNKLRQ